MAGLSLKNHLGYAVRCAAAFFAGSCQDDFESPLPLQSYKWLTTTSHAAVYIVAFARFPHISAKTRTSSGCCHIRLVRVFLVIVWVRIPLPTAPQYSFRVFPFRQACYWGFLSSSMRFFPSSQAASNVYERNPRLCRSRSFHVCTVVFLLAIPKQLSHPECRLLPSASRLGNFCVWLANWLSQPSFGLLQGLCEHSNAAVIPTLP